MKALFRIFLIIFVPVAVAAFVWATMTRTFLMAADPDDPTPVLVEIEPGKSFRAVCRELEAKGLLRNWWSLEVMVRMRKGASVVNAGEYELNPAMKPNEILEKLISGQVYQRRVTVKEGVSIWEIGALLEEAGVLSKKEFDAAVVNPGLLQKFGIPAKSFEGYLFPQTYLFSRPITADQIVWKMLEEGEKNWTAGFTEQADLLRMSRLEVLTMASIIEKESGNPEEQPTISSVVHNRLKQGMKLQLDATVIYGIANFNGNLTRTDLETPTPYNTYTNFGLPPGPICNPGASAIRATLYPAETNFLYFVADGKGRHVFSATLDEHNEAVRQYQLGG